MKKLALIGTLSLSMTISLAQQVPPQPAPADNNGGTAIKQVAESTSDSPSCSTYSLLNLCFRPAMGLVYVRKEGGGRVVKTRLLFQFHDELSSVKRSGFNLLVAPGENNLIDAVGIGYSLAVEEVKMFNKKGWIVFNVGGLIKNGANPDNDVARGGAYFSVSSTF